MDYDKLTPKRKAAVAQAYTESLLQRWVLSPAQRAWLIEAGWLFEWKGRLKLTIAGRAAYETRERSGA